MTETTATSLASKTDLRWGPDLRSPLVLGLMLLLGLQLLVALGHSLSGPGMTAARPPDAPARGHPRAGDPHQHRVIGRKRSGAAGPQGRGSMGSRRSRRLPGRRRQGRATADTTRRAQASAPNGHQRGGPQALQGGRRGLHAAPDTRRQGRPDRNPDPGRDTRIPAPVRPPVRRPGRLRPGPGIVRCLQPARRLARYESAPAR